MVDYIREVIQEAGEWLWSWADIPGLVFGLIIVGVSLLISWWRQREQEFKEKRKIAKDTLIYSALGIVLFYVLVLFFYAPYLAWKEEHDRRVALEVKLQGELRGKENVIADLQSRLDDKAEKQLICDTLGKFIEEGTALRKRSGNEKESPPRREAESWATSVESFLGTELGKSYVPRFRSSAGLRMPMATRIQSDEHLKLWTGIYIRIARLEEFSKAKCP